MDGNGLNAEVSESSSTLLNQILKRVKKKIQNDAITKFLFCLRTFFHKNVYNGL